MTTGFVISVTISVATGDDNAVASRARDHGGLLVCDVDQRSAIATAPDGTALDSFRAQRADMPLHLRPAFNSTDADQASRRSAAHCIPTRSAHRDARRGLPCAHVAVTRRSQGSVQPSCISAEDASLFINSSRNGTCPFRSFTRARATDIHSTRSTSGNSRVFPEPLGHSSSKVLLTA